MKIKMRKNYVGIQTPKNNEGNGVFIVPEDSFSTGIIKYLPENNDQLDLVIGTKVSFGKDFQTINIGNEKLKVMESDNIVAIIEESDESKEQKND